MGCFCGRMKRKRGKPVRLHARENKLMAWPEDRVEKTPDFPPRPPRTHRPPPWKVEGDTNMKLILILTDTTFAVLGPAMQDGSRDAECHFVASFNIHGFMATGLILNGMN